jgi:hypothetical protein
MIEKWWFELPKGLEPLLAWASLAVVAVLLGISILASIIAARREEARKSG